MKTLASRAAWSAVLGAVAIALTAFGCDSDSLVGGSCRAGLDECSLRCVDLQRDPNHCGACGHSCAAGLVCSAGTCGREGGTGDGGPDDASAGDVSMGDVSTGDVSTDLVSGDRSV